MPLCFLLLSTRLRKDPLDPIDSGTRVQILFRRMTDPEIMRREEEAKKRAEEAKASGKQPEATREGKKAGSWGGVPGLPSRR